MSGKSDNQAAEALAKAYSGGRSGFIANMNHKAEQLGMVHTSYEDPSGIGRKNISTARDISILLNYSHNFDTMKNLAALENVKFTKQSKRKKKQSLMVVNNTNYNLLKEYKEIEISKTGFTNAAGKCLAMLLTKNGEKYTIVILGERNTRDVQRVGRKIIETL